MRTDLNKKALKKEEVTLPKHVLPVSKIGNLGQFLQEKRDLLALATQDVVFNCSKACEIKTKSMEVEEGKQGKVKVSNCGGLKPGEGLVKKGEFGFNQVKEHITMKQEQEDVCLKQEVHRSGGLDPGEVLTVNNKEEECRSLEMYSS